MRFALFLIFLFSDILNMNIKNGFSKNPNIYEKWRKKEWRN